MEKVREMSEASKRHKRLDGDDPRIEAIFRAMAFVPNALYDEILKLGEYAVGEIIEEHNGLVEQYEGCITRESALALIEDARVWSEAYREAREEIVGLKEQLEAAERAREQLTNALAFYADFEESGHSSWSMATDTLEALYGAIPQPDDPIPALSNPAISPRPGEEMGAGGYCGRHGLFTGRMCPGCAEAAASAPASEPEAS